MEITSWTQKLSLRLCDSFSPDCVSPAINVPHNRSLHYQRDVVLCGLWRRTGKVVFAVARAYITGGSEGGTCIRFWRGKPLHGPRAGRQPLDTTDNVTWSAINAAKHTTTKHVLFWHLTPWSLVDVRWHIWGSSSLRHQSRKFKHTAIFTV